MEPVGKPARLKFAFKMRINAFVGLVLGFLTGGGTALLTVCVVCSANAAFASVLGYLFAFYFVGTSRTVCRFSAARPYRGVSINCSSVQR